MEEGGRPLPNGSAFSPAISRVRITASSIRMEQSGRTGKGRRVERATISRSVAS
jgi:hypothetical protein